MVFYYKMANNNKVKGDNYEIFVVEKIQLHQIKDYIGSRMLSRYGGVIQIPSPRLKKTQNPKFFNKP